MANQFYPTLMALGSGITSYKETTVGELPGAFDFNNMMEYEAISDDEFEGLPLGQVAIKLSRERKNKIKAS